MIILMLLGAVIFSLVAFFIFRKAKKDFKATQKTVAILLSFLIFSIGLEVTIFNVNFYNTRGNEPVSLNQYLAGVEHPRLIAVE